MLLLYIKKIVVEAEVLWERECVYEYTFEGPTHLPWPEQGSSEPGWHSAGTQAHSRAGSHSAGQWLQTTDTEEARQGVETVSGLSMQCYHHRTWTHTTDSLSTKRFAQTATAHQKLTSNKGKRSLSSSFSWFHFWISGGINIWMYSWRITQIKLSLYADTVPTNEWVWQLQTLMHSLNKS